MKTFKESGISLMEMLVATALMAFVGYAAFNYSDHMRRESSFMTEDLQNMISHFGASKVMTKDITGADGTFNFINLADDNGLPFFILARNELCKNNRCSRKFTLEIPAGQTKSRPFYLLVKKPIGPESLKFTIEPTFVYGTNNRYAAMNWRVANENESISKAHRPESPWEKNRLLLVESEMDFYDCMTRAETINADNSCPLTCNPAGSCNYVVKRPLHFLGVVNQDERELSFVNVQETPNLLRTRYKLCRPGVNGNCRGLIDLSTGVHSAQTYYEKLPYIPGGDNRTSITPVELVRYHLERKNPTSLDHTIQLKRTPATIVGNRLEFQNPHILMSGIKSLEFTRISVSNPTIEYKMHKVKARKSVK